ncbi:hypothetical protein Y032_0182g904 [Ancylostoma ceylanicum]|uniref:Uncharacterized protein n=1 Tax=Ancylostoma ceylanicum TaxID=53326 RepID=A0A016SSX6_9BILA|nr:hypothetical protein Y032_0182g904 [Ancylostoma ceylanicum]
MPTLLVRFYTHASRYHVQLVKSSTEKKPEKPPSKEEPVEAIASLSPVETNENKKDSKNEVISVPVESGSPELNIASKSFVWRDNRDNELEIRLEKLNKILSEIKEDKIRKIKESVAKWEAKYEKRLIDLELSMQNFEKKCKYDRAELSEQISRVEEMSDVNMALRQRIEKKLIAHGTASQPEQNRQRILTLALNMLRGILYYTAQIRDAFMNINRPALKPKEDTPAPAVATKEEQPQVIKGNA